MLNAFDVAMGKSAQAFRKQLGLTQEELATKLGVSRITLNRYENGRQHSNKISNYLFMMGMKMPSYGCGDLLTMFPANEED